MYLIFNRLNHCIASSDVIPDKEDLNSRQEFFIETDINELHGLNYIYKDGKIIELIEEQTIENKIEETKSNLSLKSSSIASADIIYNDIPYQATPESIYKMMIATNNEETEWYDSCNTKHILTSNDIKNILSLIAIRNTNIYKYAREVKNDIELIYDKYKAEEITKKDAFKMLDNMLQTFNGGVDNIVI